jgi:putative DNA primase/helicase
VSTATAQPPKRRLRISRADTIRTKRIPWLWKGKIPLGVIVNFAGLPGVAKSTVICSLAKSITTESPFPDGTPNERGPSEILILSTEDEYDSVLVPRLKAAGADLSKVHIIQSAFSGVEINGKVVERTVALDKDHAALQATIAENPNIRLLVIDPITNHAGDKSILKEQEIRALFEPLAQMEITTIFVCHLNKNTNLSASQRSMGAAALTGRPRAAFMFAEDTEEKGLFHMISTKANYSAKSGLRYKIVRVPVKLDDGSTEEVPCIEWLGESDANPDVLLDPKQQLQKGRPPVERDTAVEFLREFLKDGPKSAMKCTEAVQQGGFSQRTLNAAKKELGILSTREGQGPWMWELPPLSAGARCPYEFADPVTWNDPDAQSKKQLDEGAALAFLERHLKDGPRSKDDCISAAKSEGIPVPLLLKIRKDFGISSRNNGGVFFWSLPQRS